MRQIRRINLNLAMGLVSRGTGDYKSNFTELAVLFKRHAWYLIRAPSGQLTSPASLPLLRMGYLLYILKTYFAKENINRTKAV